MKRGNKVMLLTLFCVLSAVFFCGCGGSGPGSPGSTECENFGLICSVTITPVYLGSNTDNVDAAEDVCDPGPPAVFEKFTDHAAIVAVSLQLINPNTTLTPSSLFIESYTIEYRRSNDSIGSPSIQSDTRFISFSVTPPTGTDISTVTQSLIFVDIPRKDKYYQDVLSGVFGATTGSPSFINNYTAIYTIQGQINGTKVTIIGTKSFSIGDYNNC